MSSDVKNVPLNTRSHKKGLGELTINEIRNGIDQHRFTFDELEYIADMLAFRISIYLSNKFVCY